MSRRQRARRAWLCGSCSWRWAPLAGFAAAAAGLGVFAATPADAGQLPASAFAIYNPANAGTIQPGPFALFTVSVDQLKPTQMNEGFTEVNSKTNGFDILQPSQLQSDLLGSIEPVVIGPGGVLYVTDGHHTFTALENSSYGSSDPTVYVNVIANFSSDTTAQFWAAMEAADLVLPLNDGVPQVINLNTGSPIPNSLQGLTQDVYRGLEFSILKNKNSKLFKNTSNISGAAGSAIPGLDKITGLYSDFIWADAYRNANNGLGLPFLSPGDIQIATQWNLNGASVTSEPNIGTVTVAQLPGYILPAAGLTISTTISNSTLATGTLDGNGGFTGITQFNLGTPSNPILVGTPQVGLIIQLGSDLGGTVTLKGTNTYTGGTTIIAGDLIISSSTNAPSDAALGAAPPLTNAQFNSSLTLNSQGFPTNALTAVQADNGIIFNSLTEGNGTLTIGGTAGGGTNTFTTNRPIGVDSEAATINVNGYVVTLGGPLVSLGTNDVALGNANGESDLTIDDLSAGDNGKLNLSTASPNFYGNIIIGNTGAPVVEVSSDAALGATTLNGVTLPVGAPQLGQVELNGGTFQAGASFSSNRNVFLGGGSSFDTNGFATSFGTLQDTQRTLLVENSNQSGNGAGSVTFGTLEVSATATLNINAGSGSGGGAGTSITFTNGIIRDPGATLILQPTTTGNLGTLAAGAANSEDVFDTSTGPGATNKVTNGIVAPWIVIYSATPGNQTPNSPFSFATYGANGFTATAGNSTNILTATSASTVQQSANATLTGNISAYALSVQNKIAVNLGTHTLTLGDGTDPAGLILNGGASITNGALAFGGSEGIIWIAGENNNTNTISAQITGSGGLTFTGGLHATDLSIGKATGLSLVTISTATTETGQITIDSGALTLSTANVFSDSVPGVLLSNVKASPSPATLNITASNQFSALDSVGNNSNINVSGAGVQLIIGDANNENSTLSSTITQSTANVTGALTKNGSGLLDISGASVSFGSGSTVVVSGGALRIANGVFGASATTAIGVASGAELQYAGNAGSVLNDPISGAGVFHLVSGTVQLTGANTYSGGTVIETGATLDVTTSTLPTGGNVSNSGGTLLFDQSTNGTFTGVMSDGAQAGGPTDPNDMACTLASVTCGSTTTLSGTLIKDDSTTGSGGNVTLSAVQIYSGMTFIEAGTLTLGATNTIATSQGVDLGRVGGAVCNPSPCSGVTASLALGANNIIAGLEDNPANTTSVILNGHVLTLAPITGSSWSYAGSIVDGSSSGSLVQNGPGTSILTGTSTYTGTTMISGGTLDVTGTLSGTSTVNVASGGTLVGTGNIDPLTMTVMSGGTFAPGTPGVPGTSMTVTGNLAFQSGGNYLVQLNPTTSTFANVTGTATLTGGDVLAAFTAGSYASKQQYTILESTGLGGTTFAALGTVNLPTNYTATLSYTANNALLNLNAALGSGSGPTGNQSNVANSLNNFFNGGGTLAPNFLTIFGLSGGNLNTALAQLSGQSNTASEQASFSMMSSFLGSSIDPSATGRVGSGGTTTAFAPEDEAVLPPDVAQAYASVLKRAPPPAPFEQRWTAWGSSFGGYNRTDGNAAAGTNTVTAGAFGFAGGMDYNVTPGNVLGFALAGSGSNWSTAQNLGTGRSNSFQFGLYGTSRSGPAYISAALGITNHWVTTDRFAPLGDQLTARFDAQSYGGRVEGGYRYGVAAIGVTPYAALQAQLFHTPSYSETDLTGGGFGLSYAATNTTDTRSELGGRFDNVQAFNGLPLILRARLAWAHDWVSSPTLTATFETLPGANFVTNGAGVPANSLLTSAGAELWLTTNWSALVRFDGNFANTMQEYAGTGTIRYSW